LKYSISTVKLHRAMPSSKKKTKSTAKAIVIRDQLPRAIMSSGVVGSAVSAPCLVRSLNFSSVSLDGQGGCRLSGTFPFITVGAASTTGVAFVTRSGSRVGSATLSPVSGSWLCPTIARLASCFTRYRWSRLRFDYHAMGSSASAVRLAFAYCMDPYAGSIPTSPTLSDYNTLLTTPHSRVFSPWMDWTLSVPCAGELSYTYAGSSTVAANVRQNSPGQIVCVADSDPLTNYTYGVISLSFVLDLFDMLPLTSSPAASFTTAVSEEEKQQPGDSVNTETHDCVIVNSRDLPNRPVLARPPQGGVIRP